MILFLSDIKLKGTKFNDRGKNILVGNVEPVEYDKIGPSKTTNESAVKYLLKEYPKVKLDKVYVIATKMIRNEDYDKEGNPKEWRFKDTSYTENPEKIWTHLEYFFDRIRSVVPDIDEIKEVCNYDEDAPIQDSMQAVVDVAKEVQKYINEVGKVVVHADFTGGMRHANLVMLDAIRLLQYDTRVSLGKILYSNFNADPKKVEEANSVYGLVDLISGAEEFVRFGSVNSLQQYYKEKEVSAELGQVLKAMEGFAEAIRLCHYGSFTKSITDLRSALQAFDSHMESVELQNDEKALNDKFMARLESRIRHNYGMLLKGKGTDKINDLDLIEWCVDNDYLQQALTLYIERVPEVLCQAQNEIIALTTKGIELFNDVFNEGRDVRTRNFYLVNAFKNRAEQGRLDKILVEVYKKHLEEFQKISRAIKKNRPTVSAEIKACVEALSKDVAAIPGLKLNAKQIDEVALTIQHVKDIDEDFKHPNNDVKYIKSVYEDTIVEQYKKHHTQYTDKDINNFLYEQFRSLPIEKQSSKLISFLAGNLTKEAAKKIFSALYFEFAYSHDIITFIEDGIIKANIPVLDLEKILDRYGVLKNERNHSNHARADASEFTADSLGKEIKKGLADLRAAIQSIQ